MKMTTEEAFAKVLQLHGITSNERTRKPRARALEPALAGCGPHGLDFALEPGSMVYAQAFGARGACGLDFALEPGPTVYAQAFEPGN